MKSGYRIFCLLSVLLLSGCAWQSQSPPKHATYAFYRGDGLALSMGALLEAAQGVDVVFVGEQHDDTYAHQLELDILQSLWRDGLLLSLEMFETDVQNIVNEYLRGFISEPHFKKDARAWENYDSDYRPLVEFMKENHGEVVAANAPRRYVNRVSREGAAALSHLPEVSREFLPPLPYASASSRYLQALVDVMASHGKGSDTHTDPASAIPPEVERFIEAQSLWDASMAWSIARAFDQQSTRQVLHINGRLHSASRLGVVEHLAYYAPALSTLVITIVRSPQFPEFDAATMRGAGDIVVVTPAQAR